MTDCLHAEYEKNYLRLFVFKVSITCTVSVSLENTTFLCVLCFSTVSLTTSYRIKPGYGLGLRTYI